MAFQRYIGGPQADARRTLRTGIDIHFIQQLSPAHNLHHSALEDIEIGSAMIVQWILFRRHRSLFAKPRFRTGLVAAPRMPPGATGALPDPELPGARACLDILVVNIV
jgi:hypothetical protein